MDRRVVTRHLRNRALGYLGPFMRISCETPSVYLLYDLASGQYFHEGNKRTAMIATEFFLRQNHFHIDMQNERLLATLDKADGGIASLKEIFVEIIILIEYDR